MKLVPLLVLNPDFSCNRVYFEFSLGDMTRESKETRSHNFCHDFLVKETLKELVRTLKVSFLLREKNVCLGTKGTDFVEEQDVR